MDFAKVISEVPQLARAAKSGAGPAAQRGAPIAGAL